MMKRVIFWAVGLILMVSLTSCGLLNAPLSVAGELIEAAVSIPGQALGR